MLTDQAIATNQIDNRKMVLIGVGVTALAYVPLLISHFETLWRKEQYQYFPSYLRPLEHFYGSDAVCAFPRLSPCGAR